MNDVDRSRDYDGDTFRSDDPDLEAYEYENEEGGLRMPLILILLLVVIAAIVGVWFVAYNQGLEDGRAQGPGVPLVIGNEDATRQRPADPGGLPEPRSSDIFGDSRPSSRDSDTQVVPREEQIVELPEAPQRGVERPGLSPDQGFGDNTLDSPGLRGPGQVPPPGTFPNGPSSSSSLPPLPQTQSRPQPIRPQAQVQTPPSSSPSSVPLPSNRVPLPGSSVSPTRPITPPPSVPPASDTLRAPSAQSPSQTGARVPAPLPSGAAPRPVPQQVGPPQAPAGGSTGNFVVQLASLPSSTAADQTWTRITSRMGDLLSGYQKDVQVADLGARGVFYRLRVGYFQDRSAAANLCSTLKTRGQDCLVASR
ncbi:MAG: SPOR domain-containing protein [Alphaproteobacteria bacterium]